MGIKDNVAHKKQELANWKAADLSSSSVITHKVIPEKRPDALITHGTVVHGQTQILKNQVKTLSKDLGEALTSLEEARAGVPRRMLDPKLVRPSQWANRHELSFSNADFAELKQSIKLAGKNVQPIKVRPLLAVPGNFEIVFGHRRHRACLDLDAELSQVPGAEHKSFLVEAIVEDLDDEKLFVEMDRENRQRADLRPYEQGAMYRRALDLGTFKTQDALAAAIGVDKGNLSKALKLADLPAEILDAFSSRLELQYRFVKPLEDALKNDRAGVIARAKKVAKDREKSGEALTAKAVLESLVSTPSSEKQDDAVIRSADSGSQATAVHRVQKNRHIFEIDRASLTDAALQKLIESIQKLMR